MADLFTRSRLLATISAVLTLSLLSFDEAEGQSWQHAYPDQFDRAGNFFQENRAVIDSFAVAHKTDRAYLASIVAPEVGHYLASKDLIETSIVELFYVQAGSDHGNFSIGPFQMQPVFAERVEHYVQKYEIREFYHLNFPATTAGRAMRVDKIKDLRGSLEYLCAFASILEKMHFRSTTISADQKLKYAAIAYNYGFEKSMVELDRQSSIKSFPRFGDVKLSYSQMATDFYRYFHSTR